MSNSEPLGERSKTCLLFISNSLRGLCLFRLEVMQHFRQRGCKVVAIAPQDHHKDALQDRGIEFEDWKLDPYGNAVGREINAFLQLKAMIQKHQPDHIFTYSLKATIYGGWLARYYRVPYTSMMPGLGELPRLLEGKKGTLLREMLRSALSGAKSLWCLNERDRNFFLSYGFKHISEIEVLPGEGVDTHFYAPLVKTIKSPEDQRLVFLFAGRLIESKGVRLFVELARKVKKRFPNVEFRIAGMPVPEHPHGIALQEVKSWIQKGWIQYLGDRLDVRADIQDADALIQPTYYNEGKSRIIMEAAAMGKPVISTQVFGCKELILQGETGFLVPVQDLKALEEATYHMILEDEFRVQMGMKARQYILEHFDLSHTLKFYERAITQVADLAPDLSHKVKGEPVLSF